MMKILEYNCCFEIFENNQKKYLNSSHSFFSANILRLVHIGQVWYKEPGFLFYIHWEVCKYLELILYCSHVQKSDFFFTVASMPLIFKHLFTSQLCFFYKILFI